MIDTKALYPYLVPGLFNEEQAEITRPLGHGVSVMLFQDALVDGGIVLSTLMPADLKNAGLTAAEAHRIALDNLVRWFEVAWVAEEEVIACKMLGNVGEPWHFLLFARHHRAASCLLLPDLHSRCREFLQTDDMMACVAQRDSLVVFPRRDRAYREGMVTKLREIEADAKRPITFELFSVLPGEVRPFTETV